ncbi:nitrate reductase subunit alpha [Spongiactinospora sp. TRM90649]|uniref:nitrate reductase subunit alpha n=1 Tax=Spongiactinospora sp. TRM90649 TaxID=3031114 RepID=UPI0023F81687|nr:nitrate reductase subunit alpha [Spongiactinospora sp. TRM90649]MDF5751364.1 nitrate reductase subunit alpha [Spongiactinospora sp. TRM90649]
MVDERNARNPASEGPADALLRTGRFFSKGVYSGNLRDVFYRGGRNAEVFYRDRWAHDKIVRSTHGVNCTGSCSWKVYVKDGIITWETQEIDYPSAGADRPEYEPRGCPRGAAFSWYTYHPTRVRYPYVRAVLVEMYREARRRLGDPVLAWEEIVGDPERRARYQRARGKGGLVRCTWHEVLEMIAAAHVHTVKAHGPDRIIGFTPIPGQSMLSHAIGTRFLALIGGQALSFYDWYADLPVASPQVFGDQTDVPVSADWWDAAYLMMWGSNVPVTRTPDAHYMVEARYNGQKVVVVSPDYADNSKFADDWMHPHPGTDGALAHAMGHVILREFFVERQVPYFTGYVRRFTDLPFLVRLEERDGAYVPGRFLRASDLGGEHAAAEHAEWRTVLLDERTGDVVVPPGTIADRWSRDQGHWNLDLGEVVPRLSMLGLPDATGAEVLMPRFDTADGSGDVLRRGVPARRLTPDGPLVTTVFDLLLARYGVGREGLPGDWPSGYDDAAAPGTPAWQETITSVPAAAAIRIAREFGGTAERTDGRCMIIMGAGTNHWFHAETTYRNFITLLVVTGCVGRNGGGWAHYVGQEKCRPLNGWTALATASDWVRPSRQMIGTGFFFLNTDQWRYDHFRADVLSSPLGRGHFAGMAAADVLAQSARLGWMPSYPTFDRNPLDLADEAMASGRDPGEHVAAELAAGRLGFCAEDPDAPVNWPRILIAWRANLLGSSGKGAEYFQRHLLGTHNNLRATEASPEVRPRDVRWRDPAPEGKLDLLLSLDFRMTSTTLLADIVLPAATWYEKHDLNATDMHPFVHSFNPAVEPPWQARTDFEIFNDIADAFSTLAERHLGTRHDLVATPFMHDTPGEMGNPSGVARDWRADGSTPVPGSTMPSLTIVERDYPAVAAKMRALGPLAGDKGLPCKGVTYRVEAELADLARLNGTARGGPADGRPLIDTGRRACEAILALSGSTNGRLADQAFRTLAESVGGGDGLARLARTDADRRIRYADTQAHPQLTITSPEWAGIETEDRQYSAFTINVEHDKPWHTLTGRQHFYLDHDWMSELGENLPIYRPPLNMHRLFGEPVLGADGTREVTVRYLTPHNKWSIHSEYQDNLIMLSLARGGQVIWVSPQDAAAIGIVDNDWVEAVNRNGVVVARAIVSHRMPAGTVYMHHAQDRVVGVPKTETTGRRGGVHNSLTRVLLKPTHLIGGYAQFSFFPNYLGPVGTQRDEITVLRRRTQEVRY